MLQFILGLFIGANVSLFLYAMIFSAKQADQYIEMKEEKSE